jgi:hypothetical protein
VQRAGRPGPMAEAQIISARPRRNATASCHDSRPSSAIVSLSTYRVVNRTSPRMLNNWMSIAHNHLVQTMRRTSKHAGLGAAHKSQRPPYVSRNIFECLLVFFCVCTSC